MKNRQIDILRAARIRQRNIQRQPRSARVIAIAREQQMKRQTARILTLSFLTGLAILFSWTWARATEIQRVVSPSGIEAWLVEDHTVPIIAMDFSFTGGSSQDTPGKEGGVTMLSSLYDEGAADMDSQSFQTALEENAIKLGFDADRDHFYGSLRTLSPNRDLAFSLLGKALRAPRFDKAPIERMRAQWISSARRSQTDPGTIVGRTFREAAYPEHPYSMDSQGSVESLSAITRDDLLRLHKAIVTRDGLTIGVVGAIDAESLSKLLDEVFAPLPEKGDLMPVKDMTLVRSGDIHVPLDVPQTSIRFASAGIDRNDKDFYAAFLVNHILGGGSFSSRLYNEIREKRGLAYGVYSYLADLEHVSLFVGGMATRADNTDQAIMLVKQEIARLGKEGPTAKELEDAKKYLIGSYPLRFDSSAKISRQLVAIQNDNLGIDYFDKRNSYIESVTLEDAKRVAKRLLDPSKLLLVTVGKQIKHAALAPETEAAPDSKK